MTGPDLREDIEHTVTWREQTFTDTLAEIHHLLDLLYPRLHRRCPDCFPVANPRPAQGRKPSIPPRHERRWNRWKKRGKATRARRRR